MEQGGAGDQALLGGRAISGLQEQGVSGRGECVVVVVEGMWAVKRWKRWEGGGLRAREQSMYVVYMGNWR